MKKSQGFKKMPGKAEMKEAEKKPAPVAHVKKPKMKKV